MPLKFCSAGVDDVPASKDQLRVLHKTIAKVTADTDALRFNTAISAMMEFLNSTKKWENKPREALEPMLLLLAPYAPHVAEECWSRCGHKGSLAYTEWPQLDESLLVEDEITLPVQVLSFPEVQLPCICCSTHAIQIMCSPGVMTSDHSAGNLARPLSSIKCVHQMRHNASIFQHLIASYVEP
jgi:hypothetical protein